MKKLKKIALFSLVVLLNLAFFNCSKDDTNQEIALEESGLTSIKIYLAEKANNSRIDADKVEVVIFDQFKPFIQEGFDLSNDEDKFDLLNNLPTDLVEKAQELREYFVLVRKNKVEVAAETFSNTIEETIALTKNTLIDNKITDLDAYLSNGQSESCSYTSIIIGYYYNYYYGVNMPIYSSTYSCTTNRVVFYEGNNYSGDVLFSLSAGANRSVNFKNYNAYDNDEARSIKFWNFSPGQVVTVYDSPSRSTNDDYTVFTFLAGVDTVEQAYTFERNLTTSSDYSQIFNEDNGLDGKVSSVQFSGN